MIVFQKAQAHGFSLEWVMNELGDLDLNWAKATHKMHRVWAWFYYIWESEKMGPHMLFITAKLCPVNIRQEKLLFLGGETKASLVKRGLVKATLETIYEDEHKIPHLPLKKG